MADDASNTPPAPSAKAKDTAGTFADLEALQQEVARRIRDNQSFLERFMDEDFDDGELNGEEEDDGEGFEEL